MKKSKFNRPLTIAFEKDQFEEIKNYSDMEEISLAEWIRESLKAYIDKKAEAEQSQRGDC